MKNKKFEELKSLSRLMDSQFEGPLGIRFGLDGLLGLIPIVGDIATTFVSLYIIYGAYRLGCTPSTIFRMALNVALENIIEILPAFGAFFDILWRSNDKNMALLEKHIDYPAKVSFQSRLLVYGIFAFMFLLVSFSAYLAYSLILWLF